ncbi:hypothetical protein [Helicobacter sp. NHP22-001]|uniref:hypothetical protein n=1 Tax=Helicobacter sp. NHP22-001 TaxID=3040202 RepID=UPI00244D8F7D|nr:hypothetical protein [Helicobacter sp. NHP22-001]GMB96419.1 hypothetical protein NHP22001_10080 [Helicobacter sp. NHP22-001]
MADKYPNQHSFIKEIVQENGVNLAEITTNPEVAEEKATTIGLKTICELSRIKKSPEHHGKRLNNIIARNSHCFKCSMALSILKGCLHCQKYMIWKNS